MHAVTWGGSLVSRSGVHVCVCVSVWSQGGLFIFYLFDEEVVVRLCAEECVCEYVCMCVCRDYQLGQATEVTETRVCSVMPEC